MVLAAGGVPIFHYSVEGTKKLDELLSGFLSAITSFASEFGEKSVQSLSFEGSEIMYEQGDNGILFIFLVDSLAPRKVLRTVLKDLGRKFQISFADEIRDAVPIEEIYSGFGPTVEKTLDYYDEILVITSGLSPYVVPNIKTKALDIAITSDKLLNDFHRDFSGAGTRMLEAIDGEKPIATLCAELGLQLDLAYEVIQYLVIWGVVTVSRLCPVIRENDSRFDAFLDLIGLPARDYQLLNRARVLCDGQRSIPEISDRLSVTADRLYETLQKLGDQVQWKRVKIVDSSKNTAKI
jgi:hypothetical protein